MCIKKLHPAFIGVPQKVSLYLQHLVCERTNQMKNNINELFSKLSALVSINFLLCSGVYLNLKKRMQRIDVCNGFAASKFQ